MFRAVDHQWDGELFATAGAQVDIWNHNRSEPINSFQLCKISEDSGALEQRLSCLCVTSRTWVAVETATDIIISSVSASTLVMIECYLLSRNNLRDDDGDNAFHIAAETAKMICENLDWLIVMLRNSDADIEVRKHSTFNWNALL
ncbi:E3 ubiquitin-protein ligase KEG [Arachis hypogaea]|nr:E3 ubiquitin-protein ligase KEG [Arachis hypogaea]